MYGDSTKAYKEKINTIQAAVEDALAKGLMEREAYDLICEAAMKKKNTRRDRLIVVEVILYGSKVLPTELKGAESQLDNGIAMIVCGCCRPKAAGNYRFKQVAEKYGSMDEVDYRSSFDKMKLSPEIFAGSEVANIARAIM
jgi:hypothetical protein